MRRLKTNRNRSRTFRAVAWLALAVTGCASPSEKDIVFSQAFDSGKAYYQDECQKCHQADGQGLGTLYPPLANANYLKANLSSLPCIIKNGMRGAITVNGKPYNWTMPPHQKIDEIQMSAILTYIQSQWGCKRGAVSYEEARKAMGRCEE